MSKPTDTDAVAHKQRAHLNAAGAAKSLEAWALEMAPARLGQAVLDLGCGRGKLAFPYAEQVMPAGSVLAVDISADAVAEVNDIAARKGQPVRAKTGHLDSVLEELRDVRFDLIVSSYAIYYATDQVRLLSGLRALLNDGGRAFVCGYGAGTNREIKDILDRIATGATAPVSPMPDFISEREIAIVARRYASVGVHRLPNQIRFDQAETVLDWWRSHATFVPAAEETVRREVRLHISREGSFCLTKNVLGVLLHA